MRRVWQGVQFCRPQDPGGLALVFLQHHFRGLDDRRDLVALLQLHLLSASPRDDALDYIAAHFNHNVSHHPAQSDLLHRAGEMIARQVTTLKIVAVQ